MCYMLATKDSKVFLGLGGRHLCLLFVAVPYPVVGMKDLRAFALLLAFFLPTVVVSQQIWDVWQTTWDRTRRLTSVGSNPPINFVSQGASSTANILIQEGQRFQVMDGVGATLTDSSALLLNNLKSSNPDSYWSILGYTFDKGDGRDAAGMSYVRVSIGASDFSANQYSLHETAGDTAFNNFNINRAPAYLFSVLNDIRSINNGIKVHILPWSPPAWMKTTNTMNGGEIRSEYVGSYATYLLKSVQGFQSKGIPIYAVSIQNEPEHSNPTYPTAIISPSQMAQIGTNLRSLLNNNGLGGVKVIGYEHNWDHAGQYPVQMMNAASSAFNGVAFHCYAGPASNQALFTNAYPNKEVYFTECTGTYGSDYWSDIKWYLDNIFIGSVERGARAALMWNFVLDGSGNPKYPGTSSCGGPGCRPLITLNSGGSYTINQEFLAAAQLSKAIIPKDANGPWAQRIGASVSGSLSWALRVVAFSTGRANSADWTRYSIVVLNWRDNEGGTWNPQAVTATIEFRGARATFTFPVGATTLWWFGTPTAFANTIDGGNSTVARNASAMVTGK